MWANHMVRDEDALGATAEIGSAHVTDDVGESGPFDLDGGSYVSVSMG